MGAALTAALAASACCTVPLVLVSFGVGGAWVGSLTTLAPYRWIFVTLALGALAYAGYNEWQRSQRPDCDCETILSSSTRRSLLGLGALAVGVLVVSPWLIASSPSVAKGPEEAVMTGAGQTDTSTGTTASASFRQVVLEVEGMTCTACPETVRSALEGVEGVDRAETTYEPPQAVVRFDPATTSVDELTHATKAAGYPSHPKQPS
jgi:mercuric transport protein